MQLPKRNILQSITVSLAVVLCSLLSCTHSEKPRVDAIADRVSMPMLMADTVTTLISDSGITRYQIKAVRWEIYDRANPPYWEFPDGIFLEKFDDQLNTEASLRSDYAYYNEEEQIWELTGNVHAVNLEGEEFDTPQLFWNQRTERVYSDSVIRITRETSVITGIGFESNQSMTKYTIRKPQGIFPIKEE